MAMKLKYIFLPIVSVIFLLSCNLNGDNPVTDAAESYTSKKVCIYQYVDEAETDLELVREYVYASSGTIKIKYAYEYEQQADGVYLNTVTHTYTYIDGAPVLSSKGEYEYFKDYYDGVNYIYICFSEINYTYSNNVYSFSGRAVTEYDGEAAGVDGDSNEYANYTKYTIYDASAMPEFTQTCTWIQLPDGYYDYQLERYYEGDIADENLIEEYVCHYDDEAYHTRYIYEMCHFTGDDKDIYYYTQYSHDNDNIVYQQADYIYNVDADDVNANGLFSDTDIGDGENDLDQNIELANIGDQQYVLNLKFDDDGNRIKKMESLDGELISYTDYGYDSGSNLVKTTEYEEGGDNLYSDETIEYSEKYDDAGKYCYIETTCYYDYSSGDTEAESTETSGRAVQSRSVAPFIKNKSGLLKQNHRM